MRLIDFPVLVLVSSTLIAVATAATSEDIDDRLTVPVHRISSEGVGQLVGEIIVRQLDAALEFIVNLTSFPPGWHAIHVHEKPSCDPAPVDGRMVAGGAAGPHYDPEGVIEMDMDLPAHDETGVTPIPRDGKARLKDPAVAEVSGQDEKQPFVASSRQRPRPAGDLPAIHVNEDGATEYRLLTYRLQIDQLQGRSIILHQYGETPTDPGLPRGGGERIACAVVP